MSDNNGWRAHVERSHARHDLSVHMWRRHESGFVDEVQPMEFALLRHDRDAPELAQVRAPTMRLEDDIAHALLDGLVAYFGGTSDLRRAIQDLAAERKRVDKLTDALITIATRP